MKKKRIRSNQMKLIFLIIVAIALGCNNPYNSETIKEQKCEPEKIYEFKDNLAIINEIILKDNPILIKNYEAQPVEIDKKLSAKIDSIFSRYCIDVEQETEFKRFALIYLYNFKFNQYKCCVPAETEVIGESFMNTNFRDKRDAFGITMKYLLRDNRVSKNDIIYNGFTQSQINFERTINQFRDDSLLMNLIKKANTELEKAYKIEAEN